MTSAYATYLHKVRELLRIVGADPAAAPTLDVPTYGSTFVREVWGGLRLELWEIERGRETRIAAGGPDELCFHVVSFEIRTQASEMELRCRAPGVDSRRAWMIDHVRRLEVLRADWADRARAKYDAVLANHPFDDARALQDERRDELVRAGVPPAQAQLQAETEHPWSPPRPEDHRLPP